MEDSIMKASLTKACYEGFKATGDATRRKIVPALGQRLEYMHTLQLGLEDTGVASEVSMHKVGNTNMHM